MTIVVSFLPLGLLWGCKNDPPPYPPSTEIKWVKFAPVSKIKRKAVGSDNWPITWAGDNHLYTAWGDGKGFKPYTDKKLSLGVARITGGPENFVASNLRPPSNSQKSGKSGPKASGMLMVDDVLYMWVRNTGNATLVWSKDYAQTWTWGEKFQQSFGCPTFLNFGKNYENAQDDFVYIYSQDGPSAYETYDQIVLARVHKSTISDLETYQFFEGLDSTGKPLWTDDISKRNPVFVYPNHCFRLEVVYNARLKKYLMAVAYNFDGGWGLFDAPTPWGPWTIAFHTEKWDVPGTHGYRLPTKWIQDDGRTMYLIFSGLLEKGYDAFCIRKMSLSLYKPITD